MLKTYKKRKLQQSIEMSLADIQHLAQEFLSEKNAKSAINLTKNAINSSVWITRSAGDYFVKGNKSKKYCLQSLDPIEKNIIELVKDKRPIPTNQATFPEIFKAIFKDRCLNHYLPDYESQLTLIAPKTTLVLVPGVFNELFSNSAFERGAKHLQKEIGLKYYAPKINGLKNSRSNAQSLAIQLEEFKEANPDDKLWLLAFSKGGIDSLKYLTNNHDFAQKHILGLTTIASPITGTNHFDHRIIKLVNLLENAPLYSKLNKKFDLLFKEIQQSLAKENQESWFLDNHQFLPKNLFYSAIALESEFNNSHIWMMLTKLFLQSKNLNDGVVNVDSAFFPEYFNGINLGILKGHHLSGNRSSNFNQEALLEALIIFLSYNELLN